MSCRCDLLLATFGNVVRCSRCRVEARRIELFEAGFVETLPGYRQAFVDCGVEVHTILEDHTVWVPCWAEQVREAFMNTPMLAPILLRGAVDEDFLDALLTIKALAEKQANVRPPYVDGSREGYVTEKVLEFVRANGIDNS